MVPVGKDLSAPPVRDALPVLLLDRSTKRNIIFATESYAELSDCFGATDEMTVEAVLSLDIKPRALKAAEEQALRTRRRAEVFTPAWVCGMMNDHADEVWFGRPGVFGSLDGGVWTASPGRVEFPEGKSWRRYVDARRLEITCGEAPYLVSRYDMGTGEPVPAGARLGMLDRKLRIVSENADSEAELLKWALRALQSVYGYEYQGDNLLIARVNLFMTYADFIKSSLGRDASKKELRVAARVITWNLWQMDGLKGTVPNGALYEKEHQISLFEMLGQSPQADAPEPVACRIFDWRGHAIVEYNSFREGRNGSMKFDFIIGNPPYQENITDETNQAKPIYHLFVDEATKICNQKAIMITPARWYSGGIGLDDFRNRMISGGQISTLVDFPNAKECFPNISIGGGVCYFVWGKEKNNFCSITNVQNGHAITMKRALDEFPILVRYNNAITIIRKADAKNNGSIQEYVSSVSPFGISTKTRGENRKDDKHPIRLFSSKGASFISETEVVKGTDYLGSYKVLLSQTGAEHAGEPAKDGRFNVLSSTMRVLEPMDVCTHSYLVLGKFNNSIEPTAFIKYLKTKFVRVLVLQTISSIHITKGNFVFVPLQDFTPSSDIDWSQSVADIDRQLYAKYGLSDGEIEFIETHVKEMA